jgi:RimJ/RimL family protein N-acetyltransferase
VTPHLADTPVLQTKRLTLRAPAPQDVAVFSAFYATDRAQFVGGPMDDRQAWNFFGTEIGWQEVVSYIAPENHRSIALAERLGAALDKNAPQPKPEKPCLVYRHPKPGVAA